MPQVDMFDSLFDADDDGEFGEQYVIVATFKNTLGAGVCKANPDHGYKNGDIVGKLERADNPMLPVSGVCCNRCVRTITHKSSVT